MSTINWRKSSRSDSQGNACVEVAHLPWRKSSRSDSQGNNCVEVARLPRRIGVRDSKNPYGPYLTLSGRSFARLVTRVKANELDL